MAAELLLDPSVAFPPGARAVTFAGSVPLAAGDRELLERFREPKGIADVATRHAEVAACTRLLEAGLLVPRHVPLVVIGAGRSGTAFTAMVLQRGGARVGHEKLLAHGIASWMWTVDDDIVPWGTPSRPFERGFVAHQVRHPVQAIGSMATFREASWRFIARHVDAPLEDEVLVRSMRYWLLWNQRAELRADVTFRVEAIESVLPTLLERTGAPAGPASDALRSTPRSVNSRKGRYEAVSWQKLRAASARTADSIREVAESYGYDVEAPGGS